MLSSDPMRALILTAPGHEHAYVTSRLVTALGPALVGVILESGGPSLRSAWRRYSAPRLVERTVTKVTRKLLRVESRQSKALTQIIGPAPEWPSQVPTHITPSVNSPEAHQIIEDLQPTHLFVYGTGIVTDKTLQFGTALNMHTGLSPYYRGSDTYFWPLYRNDLGKLGVTVHECTARLDGGAIYARASVRLFPDDDHFAAFARCVERGAELYARTAERLATGDAPEPTPQEQIGRNYRFIDRTFVHDFWIEALVRSGIIRRRILRVSETMFL